MLYNHFTQMFHFLSPATSLLSSSQFPVLILLDLLSPDPVVHSFLLETFLYWIFRVPRSENLPGNLSISIANFSSTSALLVVRRLLDSVFGPLLWLYSSPDDVLPPQRTDSILSSYADDRESVWLASSSLLSYWVIQLIAYLILLGWLFRHFRYIMAKTNCLFQAEYRIVPDSRFCVDIRW